MKRILTYLFFVFPAFILAQPADFLYDVGCSTENAFAYVTLSFGGASIPSGAFVVAFTDDDNNLAGLGEVINSRVIVDITRDDASILTQCTVSQDGGISNCPSNCEQFRFLLFVPDQGSGACYYLVPSPWIPYAVSSGPFGPEISGWGAFDGQTIDIPATATCYSTAAAAIIGGVFPVEFRSFTAQPKGEQVELEWATESETDNAYFDLEHSVDGRTFSKIGQVAGSGTTQQAQYYQFTHRQPANGVNHYRLKQVDFDGAFEYSPIVKVEMEKEGKLEVYPNPTSGNFWLSLPTSLLTELADLEVYDETGRLVWKDQVPTNAGRVPVSLPAELSAGYYLVSVQTGNEVFRTNLIKQ
jgi:hypothetical protein